MRRRERGPRAIGGGVIPADVADFDPAKWADGSDYQRWAAWDEARRAWAVKNLPGGEDDLPTWGGVVPDQPWDEVEL